MDLTYEKLFCRSGIKVIGFSSDGDSRLLQCMKCKTPTITQRNTDEELLFQITNEKSVLHIQDHDHNGTKFRNRLLKAGIIMPMGNRIVSVSHLKVLINNHSKDKHALVMSDVCPDDRQNVRSLEKIMDPRVLIALEDFVIIGEATTMYLKICSEIVSAFKNVELQPMQRIFHMFHATYFIRAWKTWLQRPGI